jgi:glycosyltransferase involved in cell wall biosynthesis
MEWWIAGDGSELAVLKAEVARRGLERTVKVLGGRHDMADLYAQADVFVHLSYYDCYSMVVMEALVSGLPVVLLDPRVPEARIGYCELARREAGFVFVKDAGHEVAQGIRAVLRESLDRVAFAEKSRDLHTHERHIDGLLAVISAEVEKRRGRR